MHNLRQLLRGHVPLIAVGFGDALADSVIADAVGYGVDVAELRIDRYSSYETEYVLQQVRRFSGLPTVATIRITAEGGLWDLPEPNRLALFRALIDEVSAVDIELAASIAPDVVSAAKVAQKLAFVSYHNFSSTPSLSELNAIVDQAQALGADVVKIATTSKSDRDLKTLARLTIDRGDDIALTTMAMGTNGTASRLFFPALGSRLTYAYVGQPTAPGQLPFFDMFELMRKCYPAYNEKKIISMRLLEAV